MKMTKDANAYIENINNRKYLVRYINPETEEIKDRYFDRTKEICEFLDINIHSYYKLIGGHLKCTSHSTKRWANIKVIKLKFRPVKRKLIRKSISESEMANKFN